MNIIMDVVKSRTAFFKCLQDAFNLQGAFDLLQSLPSEINDALIDDSLDEKVPVHNLLEISSEFEEDDSEIKQD
ncbi:hypothetical protein TNCV_387341 [Trichonephila clavipes]|nr:hypothetical protein TNCV_387341 [Trichonephila clavipes]